MVIGLALAMVVTTVGCSNPFKKSEFTNYDKKGYIELAEYTGVALDVSYTEEEVQAKLDSFYAQYPEYEEIKTGKAKEGDAISIDYVGTIDGVAFDGGTAQDQIVTVGSSGYIDGFDEGLVGMKVGETKKLDLKFPEDYGKDELNGKDAQFEVTLNYIQKEIETEFNDAFVAKNTNDEYKTIEEYKVFVKDSLAAEKKVTAAQTAFNNVVTNTTAEKYPEDLLEQYRAEVLASFNSYISQMGMDKDTYLTNTGYTEEELDAQFEDAAKEQVKMIMVMYTIANLEDLTITDEEVKTEITTLATQYGQEEEAFRKTFEEYYNTDADAYFKTYLLQQKVIDKINELGATTTEPVSESAVQQ